MKHIITMLLFIVASTTYAQVKFEGVVKDAEGLPLELANVVAINQETKVMDAYGITDVQGRFKLSLEKNAKYTLQVSYIGLKTAESTIETKSEAVKKDFNLENDNTLDEVELVYEMPVTISGDTLIYNADSFKNGTERKLEDVLKKLPGVEVTDEGEIEVEGKTVGKVMVEGKDFFDGDSKLATKNIPASAIDKVQVLKNYSEVGQLSGVTNNQDNIAINIKLKEGKKNFWFGDITAGAGVADIDNLYILQPKLFYYSPEYSINFIGDLNNLGELAFTRRDYFNFAGGFRSPSSQSGTNINLGSNGLNFSALQNNRAKDISTKFGALNFSYAPKKTLDLSGFAIFTSNRTTLQENSNLVYNAIADNPNTTVNESQTPPDELTQDVTKQGSELGMLKLSAKYKPNASNQLDYDILGKLSSETQNKNLFSSINGDVGQLEETKPFSINQNVNYYYTLNEKNIFAFEAQHLYQDEDPFYNATLERLDSEDDTYGTSAEALGLDNMQANYNIAQEKRVKSNQLDAKLDYWNVLNLKSDINFTLGLISSKQDFDSEIFQFLDNGSTFYPTATINNGEDTNNTVYNFSDLYVATHYRFKTGMFTFTPGLSAHAYATKNTQFNTEYKDSFFRVLPDFTMLMQLKKSEQIVFNYKMQTQFTDVTQLARGIVLNNYNSLYSGSPILENALSHNLNLSYFSFNMFNYTNVFANVNYNKSVDNIRSASVFLPLPVDPSDPEQSSSNIRVSSPFNSNFSDESLSVNGRLQRTFGKYRTSLRAGVNYSKFNQFINGIQSTNENYTQNYRAELRTNYRNAPNFEIGYRYVIQDNDQGATRSKFYTHAPSVEFDALIFKTFTFKTDYTYNDFRDANESINSYEFWNASLAYRKNKDSKLEYEIKATNLLDTKSQNNTSAGVLAVSTTEYFIQPRYVTFRLIYSL